MKYNTKKHERTILEPLYGRADMIALVGNDDVCTNGPVHWELISVTRIIYLHVTKELKKASQKFSELMRSLD